MIIVNVFHMTTQYDVLVKKKYCNIAFKLNWSYYQVNNLGFQMVSSIYKKEKEKMVGRGCSG